MDLQQIIPGTLKQGYLTKSPPLDKGGIKVRSCVLTEPLTRVARSGARWLWFKYKCTKQRELAPVLNDPQSQCVAIFTHTKPPPVDS